MQFHLKSLYDFHVCLCYSVVKQGEKDIDKFSLCFSMRDGNKETQNKDMFKSWKGGKKEKYIGDGDRQIDRHRRKIEWEKKRCISKGEKSVFRKIDTKWVNVYSNIMLKIPIPVRSPKLSSDKPVQLLSNHSIIAGIVSSLCQIKLNNKFFLWNSADKMEFPGPPLSLSLCLSLSLSYRPLLMTDHLDNIQCTYSWFMLALVSRSTQVQPCVGVHKRTSLMSLS